MKAKASVSLCISLALFVGVCLSAEEAFKLSSLIVPKGTEQRNPTTEIHVGFGDVHHVSPWCLKRRFPRNGGPRGGQLVTLRDAMLAINEFVAQDEEMPLHTFMFADGGSLTSICDIPFSSGEDASIGIVFNGAKDKMRSEAPDGKLLDSPIRDFAKIEFVRLGQESHAAAHHAGGVAAKDTAGSRKTGAVKTIELPGGEKMEMIWCAAGSFIMGSPVSEEGRFEDEPQHKVTLTKGFWLGKYEVTQAQWKSVMGSNPSRFKGDKLPVETVSWIDCQQFIGKVNAAMDHPVRLPTEAEWEYACRAGTTGAVSGSGKLGEMAWYDVNSENQTHEVGIHKPNAWGFYDMHGNVLEWCSDWFAQPGAVSAPAIDPKGPAAGHFRMLRGGCWFYFARDCRSAYRLKRDPNLRNSIFGLRLAISEQ